jgi:hypothetical protein
MDHRYIDEFSVAERYLRQTLSAEEVREFEVHVVTCPECADRVLLAQIWLKENKLERPKQSGEGSPLVRFLAAYRPWQLALILALAALALLSVPAIYFLRELSRLAGR